MPESPQKVLRRSWIWDGLMVQQEERERINRIYLSKSPEYLQWELLGYVSVVRSV